MNLKIVLTHSVLQMNNKIKMEAEHGPAERLKNNADTPGSKPLVKMQQICDGIKYRGSSSPVVMLTGDVQHSD